MLNPFHKKEGAKKPKKKPAKIKTATGKMSVEKTVRAQGVVLRPIVSEKSTMLSALNQYVFEVNPEANRIEIKKGIETLYNVHVVRVNTIPEKGKFVRYGRTAGWTKKRKKAIITLLQGEKIEVSKGV